ncbi:MAG: response regulator receiver protein [Myxococcales bacterium]|nr:response regulator receiver protein [Myxococcales bacterium]
MIQQESKSRAKRVTAIAIAPAGATGTLRVLIERLAGVGIEVAIADDVAGGAELAGQAGALPAILIDLREFSADSDIEDIRRATELIRRTCAAIPHALPVAITGEADVALLIACIRAGAGDVIDLQAEGTAAAREVVQRIFQRQLGRTLEARTSAELRTMIEELLKDLIRTERRSIDLEASLAAARGTGQVPAFGPDSRVPAVLLVEPDRENSDELAEQLEGIGICTFTYLSGEDAVREAAKLVAAGSEFDLAVVNVQLPGIDGLATVKQLRDHFPGLPAFLTTSTSDTELAADAADLGVVGFVQTPLEDVQEVVERVAQLAHESLQRTREHLYLQRIKARHEHVLARYRSLPRE